MAVPSRYRKFFVKILIERNVNISNLLNFFLILLKCKLHLEASNVYTNSLGVYSFCTQPNVVNTSINLRKK